MQVSHHWFTALFSMIAAWATLSSTEDLQQPKRWPVSAGIASGMGAMVTPTVGALAMLASAATFLNLRRREGAIPFLLSCGLVPVGIVVYLIANHSFIAAFDDVILWTANRYAPIQAVPFGWLANAHNFLLVFMFPLAGLLAAITWTFDRSGCLRDGKLLPCVAFGIAGLVGCFPRADIEHISFTVPLVCPLLARCLTRLTVNWRRAHRHYLAIVAIWLCAPSAVAYWWIMQNALGGEAATTPRGDVVFVGLPGMPAMLARMAATPSEDAYFFYSFIPMFPFIAARNHVSKYDYLQPGYSLPSQYHDACLSAVRNASWVVIDRLWTDPIVFKQQYPAIKDPQPLETKRFEDALDSAFEFIARDGIFELRRRRNGVNEDVCASITQ